jgi:hypothetical protein
LYAGNFLKHVFGSDGAACAPHTLNREMGAFARMQNFFTPGSGFAYCAHNLIQHPILVRCLVDARTALTTKMFFLPVENLDHRRSGDFESA